MKLNLFQKVNEPEVDGGSAGPAVGEGLAPSLETSVSTAAVPDFAELATWDESLEHADPTNTEGNDAGAAAAPAAPTPEAGKVPSQPDAQSSAAAPAQPTAAAPAPTNPPGQTVVPPTTAPAPTAATPAGPTAERPEELTFEQHREKAIPELAKLFQMTPEEVESFQTEPEKHLPTLAARVAFESMNMAYVSVMRALPNLIQGQMDHLRNVTDANDKFFKQWPELNKPEHRDMLVSAIKATKHANPGADMEKIIKLSGALAYINLGLPLPNQNTAPAPTPTPSAPRPSGVGATGAPLPRVTPQQGADPIADLVQMELEGRLD